jgi:enamine deaminase RidA (YjgF/YER057c/UK114 family)
MTSPTSGLAPRPPGPRTQSWPIPPPSAEFSEHKARRMYGKNCVLFRHICTGQVVRTADLTVIDELEAQFRACWENLRAALDAAGCTFEDVVDMATYHVDMSQHMVVFREVKDRVFPRDTCARTAI